MPQPGQAEGFEMAEKQSEWDISVEDLKQLLDDETDFFLLDVREPDEYEQGAIPGSIHIPRGNLEASIENRITDRHQPLVVMCAGGVRSAFAAGPSIAVSSAFRAARRACFNCSL